MNARLGIAVMGVLLASACSGAPERPPPPAENETAAAAPEAPDTGDGTVDTPSSGACETGATRSCKVQLPTHGSIETCYLGVNLCVDGVWSECGDEDALVEKYLGGS
ncbi:MAG: hypothetical protein HS104_16745 [Polyangiaceae bacterium]|nr:hypothetical protein [Polyangiaceae bacterium]MCL4755677.1 hypothetical protein [Myxococcales bacterium]